MGTPRVLNDAKLLHATRRVLRPRDVEWLQALADGKQTTELQGRTYQGRKNGLGEIRACLNARTMTHAVAMALRKGIIR